MIMSNQIKNNIFDSFYETSLEHGNLDFPVAVYNITLSEMAMNVIRWHWHDEIEMLYLIEGTMKVLVDNTCFKLKEGQGIFINQNVLHSMNIMDNSDAVFKSVVFHPSFMFGYGRTVMSVKFLTPLVENRSMKYLLFDSDSYLMKLLIESITLLNEKKSGYELLCKSNLCKMWYLLLQISNTTIPKGTKTKNIANDELRIKEAILYIESHYTEEISLDDIAESIHISKSECCRCFKRVLHLTPFEYLIKYRIYSATKAIQRADSNATSIGTLATSVGFSNISYFNKVLKNYLGLTPTEYKKKQKIYISPDEEVLDMTMFRN